MPENERPWSKPSVLIEIPAADPADRGFKRRPRKVDPLHRRLLDAIKAARAETDHHEKNRAFAQVMVLDESPNAFNIRPAKMKTPRRKIVEVFDENHPRALNGRPAVRLECDHVRRAPLGAAVGRRIPCEQCRWTDKDLVDLYSEALLLGREFDEQLPEKPSPKDVLIWLANSCGYASTSSVRKVLLKAGVRPLPGGDRSTHTGKRYGRRRPSTKRRG